MKFLSLMIYFASCSSFMLPERPRFIHTLKPFSTDSGDCKCDKIEETSDSSDKEEIQEALKRIANAKRIFLNNKRIK